MSRRPVPFGVLLAIAVVVTGCGGGTSPSATAPASLPGTSWTLGLQGGTKPAAQDPPTVVFASDGKANGFGGCQPYTATYVVDGSSLHLADIAKTPTQNQCAPAIVQAQDAFLAALAGVTAWRTEAVQPTAGDKVLQPVKLLLDGQTALVFTLQ